MNDKELFNAVADRMVETYHIIIEHPYNDGYTTVKSSDGNELGAFNTDGYNLLRNLTLLTDMLNHELR